MIANLTEYHKAQEELHTLEERLQRLQQSHPVGSKGFTKAGIRKLIARFHEELALFEGSEAARRRGSPRTTECPSRSRASVPPFLRSVFCCYQVAYRMRSDEWRRRMSWT